MRLRSRDPQLRLLIAVLAFMAYVRRILALVVLGFLVSVSYAAASPMVMRLRPHWTDLHGEVTVRSVGRYMVGQRPGQTSISPLVDGKTGAQIQVPPPPDCAPSPILLGEAPGATSLGVYCNNAPNAPTIETYPVPDGPWTSVPVPSTCLSFFTDMGSCDPTEVGRYWIAYTIDCYHCTTFYAAQNIASGAFTYDSGSTGPRQIADLSSPTLASPLCSSTTFASSIDNSTIADRGFILHHGRVRSWTLRRCGQPPSIHFRPLIGRPAVEPHLVLWIQRNTIDGVSLPDQRQIVLTPPRNAGALANLTLTPERIYLTARTTGSSLGSPSYDTWTTTWPQQS